MPSPAISTKANWPQPLVPVYVWRQKRLKEMRASKYVRDGAKLFYSRNPATFILDWCDTYDPRNVGTGRPTRMPFLMFEKQVELVEFLEYCTANKRSGLIEKARDMGATWVSVAYSVWLWLFQPGASIGWGSRKEQLVDKLGEPDSIFEKLRMCIMGLPRIFWPKGFSPDKHMHFMRIVNPENGSTITGEAGDNIGRGGRKTIYFKDESAHYERPELIEAALGDNTNVQIDISSVNGLGNVYHRRREAGMEWRPGVEVEANRTAVFIMDWSDHPAKDQQWYDDRKQKAESEGLLHKFKQEVDRDYAASVEGVVIPADWVTAAIDAHVKLGLNPTGGRVAALDVADGGGDTNALFIREGILGLFCDQWGAPDTGVTTRKAITICRALDTPQLEYDSIGVGAGVKSEANRLLSDPAYDRHPVKVKLYPWNAGAGVHKPDSHVGKLDNGKDDKSTATNREMFANFKAQAWWALRMRFYLTYRAVQAAETGERFDYDPDEIISLPSNMANLQTLRKELSQATMSQNGAMKTVVDKAPEGTKSPNLADSCVMCYFPSPKKRAAQRVATSLSQGG